MRTFVVGDIHGCYEEMHKLILKLMTHHDMNPRKDRLVFLGDYTDRGPDSKKVIDKLMEWEKKYPHWVFLYGNHEDLMLDALVRKLIRYDNYNLWWKQGGKETFESYVPPERSLYEKSITQVLDVIPAEHLKWLMDRPYYFEDENYFYVHAGVIPNMSLEELKPHLDEAGDNDFKYEVIWTRDKFIDSTYDWGKKIIFGHTADGNGQYYNPANQWGKNQKLKPIVKKNKIGIDTAVCPPSSNGLTILELPTEKFYFQRTIK